MFKVTFKFESGEEVETFAASGEDLLEVARKTNVAIDAPCSGNASCGKCKVKLAGGQLESQITRHITEEEYADGWRLACISQVSADVEILVPDIASAYRSRMKVADLSSTDEVAIFEKAKNEMVEAGIDLRNSLQTISITMDIPSLDDTMPDNERLMRALTKATGKERIVIPYSVMRKMPNVLRTSDFYTVHYAYCKRQHLCL